MTVRDVLAQGQKVLAQCQTDTPRLDADLLLACAQGIGREKLYMNLRGEVDPLEFSSFQMMLQRRMGGEPVAWITKVKEFWGMDFHVGPGVLCPRPDSEVLVETALEFMGESTSGRLHDCCCGPGPLAAALAVERPLWHVSASDISDIAGEYFNMNNRSLTGGRIRYIEADLLEGFQDVFDIIVSNPPYLTRKELAERRTLGWKEPALALDGGGEDGLELVRRLVPQAAERLRPGGVLLLEASPLQIPAVKQILLEAGFDAIGVRKDLGARDRVIYGRCGGTNGSGG